MEHICLKIKKLIEKVIKYEYRSAVILSIVGILMSITTLEEITIFLGNLVSILIFIMIMSNLSFIIANGFFILMLYCIYKIVTG